MKRKGFTLIELLAVIVVLAIIALIATPTILGVIEKARRGAAEQSALGYIDAVEMQVSLNSLDLEKEDIKDGVYTVSQLKKLEVSIKGQSPSDESWVKIKNGRVVAYSLKFGRYTITLDENNNKVIEKDGEVIEKPDDSTTNPDNKKYTVYSNGTAVYYNPETNSKCNESEAVSTTGTKTGCMEWYTFNDEGENASTVNMILDHNTTAHVAWNSTGSNSEMKEVTTALTTDTTTWNSSLNARLITANEVAKITGNTRFDASKTGQSVFYFDSNTNTQTATSKGTSKYAWLFDYTHADCFDYGCYRADSKEYPYLGHCAGGCFFPIYGYWTSTPIFGSADKVWLVTNRGKIDSGITYGCNEYNTCNRNNSYVGASFVGGLRPVITVSKSVIS